MSDPTITPFNVGRLRFNLSNIYRLSPDHPQSGQTAHVPIYCYHIALPNRSILVDAPAYEPEHLGKLLIPDFVPPPSLLEQFATAGINPEKITDVIITHRHFDHFNAVTRRVDGRHIPSFPNAHHYLGSADWQPDDFRKLEERTLMVIHNAGLLQLIEEPTDLGDGLTIIPKPGETPGHQILSLENDGRRAYFTGDLYHHQTEFGDMDTNVYWAEPASMKASKLSFLETVADTGSHIYFAHIPGPYEVNAADTGYEWRPAQ